LPCFACLLGLLGSSPARRRTNVVFPVPFSPKRGNDFRIPECPFLHRQFEAAKRFCHGRTGIVPRLMILSAFKSRGLLTESKPQAHLLSAPAARRSSASTGEYSFSILVEPGKSDLSAASQLPPRSTPFAEQKDGQGRGQLHYEWLITKHKLFFGRLHIAIRRVPLNSRSNRTVSSMTCRRNQV
jgi:hypothetical protein